MVERNITNIEGSKRWEYSDASERLFGADGREHLIRNQPDPRPRRAPRRTATVRPHWTTLQHDPDLFLPVTPAIVTRWSGCRT